MRASKLQSLLAAALISVLPFTLAAGELSDNTRISSGHLGYDLQYRVYTPSGVSGDSKYPVMLVTDGQWYLAMLGMVEVLDDLISSGRMEPVYVVFVDSRNPEALGENRRTEEFMCNVDYVNFYTAELLPSLYERYPIAVDREDTAILGLSFGGLNSACFGALASNRFYNIGMHSPASDKHLRVVSEIYEKTETLPLRVFISAGTVNDNFRAANKFRKLLEEKGYEVTWVENTGKAHNWENWRELIDDVLLTFFASDSS